MLSRLGLVIHWLAFVLGDIYILVFLYNIIIEGTRLSAGETVAGVIFFFLFCTAWVGLSISSSQATKVRCLG